MRNGKDPLSTLLEPLHKTPFQHFSVPQNGKAITKNLTTFFSIFRLKCLTMANFQFLTKKNRSKSSLASLNLCQKSILKAAFC